ncbi:MAG: lysophospholipase [Rhodospirillaceae bacterium]|nr:lysophospholipase [Rhodospirillaceae bacterium]
MIRAAAALAASLLIAACAPTVAPPGPGAHVPQLTGKAFITSDGLSLPVRQWLPDGQPKAVVLALHGFNDYSKAFDKVPGAPGVGPYLASQGIAVFAYDQRGFGATANRGLWPGRDALVGDFTAMTKALKGAYPDLPLYVMGESMGGAVVMAALATGKNLPVAGAVLAAPAVWGKQTMPVFYRVALWVGSHLLPRYKPTGKSLGRMASDNIEMLRDNGRDPLFIKETRVDAVSGLSDLMDEALAVSGEIRVPVLYLYGKKDEIIPEAPSLRAMAAMTGANKAARTAIYPDGWHMIMRDRDAATVLGDVAAFIADPKAPLPSGLDRGGPGVRTAGGARVVSGGF